MKGGRRADIRTVYGKSGMESIYHKTDLLSYQKTQILHDTRLRTEQTSEFTTILKMFYASYLISYLYPTRYVEPTIPQIQGSICHF